MKEKDSCSACLADRLESEDRRKLLRLATGSLVAGLTLSARAASAGAATAEAARVLPGDLLVEEDAEGELVPLKLSDIKPGKPLMAFPLDAAKGAARTESRFNKVILVRVDESEMDAATKAAAVDGVIAFSGVCTHHGCDVKTWMSKERVLACFCHGSKFSPYKAGAVTSGPAPRSLPLLPLAAKDGKLVVAGEFSAPPGTSIG